jgi:hypothetical protein
LALEAAIDQFAAVVRDRRSELGRRKDRLPAKQAELVAEWEKAAARLRERRVLVSFEPLDSAGVVAMVVGERPGPWGRIELRPDADYRLLMRWSRYEGCGAVEEHGFPAQAPDDMIGGAHWMAAMQRFFEWVADGGQLPVE